MQQEFAGAIRTGGPALRRGQNPVNGVVDFLHELRSSAGTALAIPARSLFSLFDRSGMDNENRSLAHSAAEESFRRNVSRDTGLTLPESKIFNAAGDFFVPGGFHGFGIVRGAIQTLQQRARQFGAFFLAKGEGTLQQFSGVLRHGIIIRPESGHGTQDSGLGNRAER